MLPDPKDLPPLAGPHEILDLPSGGSVRFRVLAFSLGRMSIRPRDGRDAKDIVALRVVVDPADKLTTPPYWDITGQLTVVSLLANLQSPDGLKRVYSLSKQGYGPAGRMQLTAEPM